MAKQYNLPLGFDIDDICDRVEAACGDRPARGTISAIETGTRGVSAELLTALELAYGTRPGSITTTYEPRCTPSLADEVA
ncbi:transcriptional regulator [Mycolicibacterium bacteremicum]|uniref:Transcriptional regulator n=1 Tax=Mycolicibacterium bacteremicum TaxID=564198 RepID=A0A1W9YQ49_MYCBA|nr:transcriptional regulator [Mycolicibacterium bacteremicum]